MKKILLILILFSLLAGGFVRAVAVKVRPSKIEAEIKAGVLSEREILVENPDNNVAFFEVYPDNFSDWIKAKPESFILEGGESQKVVLEIENKETGVFLTMISVVAKPLSERQFKTNSGIKIPLEIRVSEREGLYFLANISQFLKSPLGFKAIIYILSFFLILAGAWITKRIIGRRLNAIKLSAWHRIPEEGNDGSFKI